MEHILPPHHLLANGLRDRTQKFANPGSGMMQPNFRGSQRTAMKKNFSLAVAVLRCCCWVRFYQHVAWQQLTSIHTIDGPVAKRLDGRKEEEEKPAADSTDAANSSQANSGETSTTSKKTRSRKRPRRREPSYQRVRRLRDFFRANPRLRPKAPGRQTARTRIPLQRQLARQKTLQLILRRARRRHR